MVMSMFMESLRIPSQHIAEETFGAKEFYSANLLGLGADFPPYLEPSMTRDSLRLAQEALLLHTMQENARLVHENMLLRLRGQTMAPPPGLEVPARSASKDLHLSSGSNTMWQPLLGQDLKSNSRQLDVSTTASSSPGCSADSSRNHSSVSSLDASYCSGIIAPASNPSHHAPHDTTMMMRNLPNDYSREMLIDLLIAQGYERCFDLVYLPIDFQSNSGLGYAFVNFLTPEVAERFCRQLSGFRNWCVFSDKVCEVSSSTSHQGLQAHIERYRNSPVMHESVPECYRPVLFRGSERVPFPPPTKKIRAPRHWHRRQQRGLN